MNRRCLQPVGRAYCSRPFGHIGEHGSSTTAEFPISECTCMFSCGGCSLSGREWHVHPQDSRGVTGPCPLHPEAPGDL